METIETFTKPGTSKHNWDDYIDGRVRRATEGVDYVKADLFRSNAHTQAARRGMKAETQSGAGFVEFRLVPRD